MNQTIRVVILSIMFTMLFVGIIILNALLFDYIFDSVNWMIFSMFISLSGMIIIINYVFPVVFKDYIKEFYEKEEFKNAQKEK